MYTAKENLYLGPDGRATPDSDNGNNPPLLVIGASMSDEEAARYGLGKQEGTVTARGESATQSTYVRRRPQIRHKSDPGGAKRKPDESTVAVQPTAEVQSEPPSTPPNVVMPVGGTPIPSSRARRTNEPAPNAEAKE